MTQTINGLRVERRSLAGLKPAPWNPRRMDQQQAKALEVLVLFNKKHA